MNRRRLFVFSLVLLAALTTTAGLYAQGKGTPPGRALAEPLFDETIVTSTNANVVLFNLPPEIGANFDRAVVDIQVLEPPPPPPPALQTGRATTNFLSVETGFLGFFDPTPLMWSRFADETSDRIRVFALEYAPLAAGQEIRVRIWLHR